MTVFKPSKCATKFCRGRTTQTGRSPYCSRCRSRRWKDNNPLAYSFKNLRVRARQRGKEFTLTFDQYLHFAESTDYSKLKGKTKYSLSIHRIDNDRGYHADNISAITLSMNSRLAYVEMNPKLKAELMALQAAGAAA